MFEHEKLSCHDSEIRFDRFLQNVLASILSLNEAFDESAPILSWLKIFMRLVYVSIRLEGSPLTRMPPCFGKSILPIAGGMEQYGETNNFCLFKITAF
jgi:hypothetical protein